MPTTLTPVPADPNAQTLSSPADTEAASAASVDGAFQYIINWIAWIRARLARLDAANTFAAVGNRFQELVYFDKGITAAAADTANAGITAYPGSVRPGLNIQRGTAPSGPQDGDIWLDASTDVLHVRIAGVVKTFTLT
jgi:hypothetical protein